MAEFYALTLNVRVHTRADLFAAALKHAVEVDKMSEADARTLLSDESEPDAIDVFACLRMVFDPGVSPDGCEIEDSEVAFAQSDDEEDGLTEDQSSALKGRFKAYFAAHGYPASIAVMSNPALQSLADEHPNEWAEACQEWEEDDR